MKAGQLAMAKGARGQFIDDGETIGDGDGRKPLIWDKRGNEMNENLKMK